MNMKANLPDTKGIALVWFCNPAFLGSRTPSCPLNSLFWVFGSAASKWASNTKGASSKSADVKSSRNSTLKRVDFSIER